MSPKNTHCNMNAASSLSSSLSISTKIPVFVLLGPTAIGKTALALALAAECNLEILSCDSRQIYRGMNIGTAKSTPEEMGKVRHWGIDILDPSEAYSAYRFAHEASAIIRERAALGKRILICGGTGFYFKALTEGGSECEPSLTSVKDSLTAFCDENGNEVLYKELIRVDPQSARRIHPNDRQRIIRALAVYRQTGRPLSTLYLREKRNEDMHFIVAKLRMERISLYERINRRVMEMIDRGLWDEFQLLVDTGYNDKSPGMRCVGYQELFGVKRGEYTYMQAIEKIQQNTRRYAKRQITWFSTQVDGCYFENSVTVSTLKDYFLMR